MNSELHLVPFPQQTSNNLPYTVFTLMIEKLSHTIRYQIADPQIPVWIFQAVQATSIL